MNKILIIVVALLQLSAMTPQYQIQVCRLLGSKPTNFPAQYEASYDYMTRSYVVKTKARFDNYFDAKRYLKEVRKQYRDAFLVTVFSDSQHRPDNTAVDTAVTHSKTSSDPIVSNQYEYKDAKKDQVLEFDRVIPKRDTPVYIPLSYEYNEPSVISDNFARELAYVAYKRATRQIV